MTTTFTLKVSTRRRGGQFVHRRWGALLAAQLLGDVADASFIELAAGDEEFVADLAGLHVDVANQPRKVPRRTVTSLAGPLCCRDCAVGFYRDVHRRRMRRAATGLARRSGRHWPDCASVLCPMCNGAHDCAHCQSTVPRGYR